MPFDIQFDGPPSGYAADYTRAGEKGKLIYREFVSTQDGQLFIQRLEGFPETVLKKLSPQKKLKPSEVDHLLAVIRTDGTATVYVNELTHIVSIRVNTTKEPGDPIYKDDIVEFGDLDLGDVSIPDDCGVVFLFSIGWRKGLYYDFGPLPPCSTIRDYRWQGAFGQMYADVFFQERFSIPDNVWDQLFQQHWFPFSSLKDSTITKIINQVKAGWKIDELLDEIISEVKTRTAGFLASWEKHKVFEPHIPVLSRAIEHFDNGDYISCTAIIYPRIEGVLRTNLLQTGATKFGQPDLSKGAVAAKGENLQSLLLPHKFSDYLSAVYFASFNPADNDIAVSRNGVSHGVSNADRYDAKAAVIGVLLLQHLFYCFEPLERSHAVTVAEKSTGS